MSSNFKFDYKNKYSTSYKNIENKKLKKKNYYSNFCFYKLLTISYVLVSFFIIVPFMGLCYYYILDLLVGHFLYWYNTSILEIYIEDKSTGKLTWIATYELHNIKLPPVSYYNWIEGGTDPVTGEYHPSRLEKCPIRNKDANSSDFIKKISNKKIPEHDITTYDILYGYWLYCRNFLTSDETLTKIDGKENISLELLIGNFKESKSFHLFYYKDEYLANYVKEFLHLDLNDLETYDSIEDFKAAGHLLGPRSKIFMCTSLENNYVFVDRLNMVRVHKIIVQTASGKSVVINLSNFDWDFCHKTYIFFLGDKMWDYLNLDLRKEEKVAFFKYEERVSSIVELSRNFDPIFFYKYSHLLVKSTKDFEDLLKNFENYFSFDLCYFNTIEELQKKFCFDPKFDKYVLIFNKETNCFFYLFIDLEEKKIFIVKNLDSNGDIQPIRDVRYHDYIFNNTFILKPLNKEYNIFKSYLFIKDIKLFVEDLEESSIIFFFNESDWIEFKERLELKTSFKILKNKSILYFTDPKMLETFLWQKQTDITNAAFGHVCYIFINETEYYVYYVFYFEERKVFFIAAADPEAEPLTKETLDWVKLKYLNNTDFYKKVDNIHVTPIDEKNVFNQSPPAPLLNRLKGRFFKCYIFDTEVWELLEKNIAYTYDDFKNIKYFHNGYEELFDYMEDNNLEFCNLKLEKAITLNLYSPETGKLYASDVIITKKHVWFVKVLPDDEDRSIFELLIKNYSPYYNRDLRTKDMPISEIKKIPVTSKLIYDKESKNTNIFITTLAKGDHLCTEEFWSSHYNTINFFNKKDFNDYIYMISTKLSSDIPEKKVVFLNSSSKDLIFELKNEEGVSFNPTDESNILSLVNVFDKKTSSVYSFNVIETEKHVFVIPQVRSYSYFYNLGEMVETRLQDLENMNIVLKNPNFENRYYFFDNCSFCEKQFKSFFFYNFVFHQNPNFFKKDIFFSNKNDLILKLRFIIAHKDKTINNNNTLSANNQFCPVNFKENFVEPAKLVCFSEKTKIKQLEHIEKNFSLQKFTSVENFLKNKNFKISQVNEEALKKKNFNLFNEILQFKNTENFNYFCLSHKFLILINDEEKKAAIIDISDSFSDFDSLIANTVNDRFMGTSYEEKNFYLSDEYLIYLKENKTKVCNFCSVKTDSSFKFIQDKKKLEIFIEDTMKYLKNKKNDEF